MDNSCCEIGKTNSFKRKEGLGRKEGEMQKRKKRSKKDKIETKVCK